jgi:thiol-disulfide isomerase/thioredoxin
MRVSCVAGRLDVVFGLTVLLALPASAPGQAGDGGRPATQAKPAAAGAGAEESVQAINEAYERQVLELDRHRLDQLTRLAGRQEPAAAAATYEQIFRLAMAGNLFRDAEPAAAAVVKGGSPSPAVVSLAYLVKIVAECDRGAYDASLATVRQAIERSAKAGAARSALLASEVVSLCDAYYQRLVQADQFAIARQAFRLALENTQNPELRSFLAGRLTRLDLVGKTAPAIRGKDLDGKPFDLAKTKGEVVFVVFWASWCLPNGTEVEWLKETDRAYHARGFRVVGVNVDGLRNGGESLASVLPDVRRFLLDHNIVWPTLVNGAGDADYARAYGVTEIPANVLIAKDGTVAHVDLVRDHLDDAIAKEVAR